MTLYLALTLAFVAGNAFALALVSINEPEEE